MFDKVTLIEGNFSIDDRGEVSFCNGFDMKDVRRFYIVSNHQPKFIRAWHGHKKESKFVLVLSGAALVAAVKIDNWDSPDKKTQVQQFVLSGKKPSVLAIPPGYANGFMTLSPDTRVMFFSDRTLEETRSDDYRYDARYWDPWQVTER